MEDEALRSYRDLLRRAERWKPPDGPVVLTEEYLRLVERAERLPQNRPGTDKTWVERALAAWRHEVRTARKIPRA
jgi:hypothetical protein